MHYKGGAGSGFKGHAGRPGEVGGSFSGKFAPGANAIITVYRGYMGDIPISRTGITFYSPNPDYAAKYGKTIEKKKLDTSKLFDTRNKKDARILDLINKDEREYGGTIVLDPRTRVPFYSDAFRLRSLLRQYGYKYKGVVLAESTFMGHGGISYGIFTDKE